MTFQNPSFKFFFERTDEQTDGQTDGQAECNMLPTFQSWGHKKRKLNPFSFLPWEIKGVIYFTKGGNLS